MPEIIADVVAAKRQHCHWITTDLSDRTGRGCGCFRSHRRAEINAVLPIERLKHERHRIAAPAAEDDRTDRHAFAALHIQIERRIIAHRRGEPTVRMRRFLF